MKNSKKPYLPDERGYNDEPPKTVRSYSKKDSTKLPDNVQDPIVANNIAYSEFDYTDKYWKDDPYDD